MLAICHEVGPRARSWWAARGGRLVEHPEFLRFGHHWGFRIRACIDMRAPGPARLYCNVYVTNCNPWLPFLVVLACSASLLGPVALLPAHAAPNAVWRHRAALHPRFAALPPEHLAPLGADDRGRWSGNGVPTNRRSLAPPTCWQWPEPEGQRCRRDATPTLRAAGGRADRGSVFAACRNAVRPLSTPSGGSHGILHSSGPWRPDVNRRPRATTCACRRHSQF